MKRIVVFSMILMGSCIVPVSAQNSGYVPSKTNERPAEYKYPLDVPPPFHTALLDFGERPVWSPDGKRIAFVESNYGDICEIDMATRQVKNLTKGLGEHHSFLRVHYLPSGDYILVGPAHFKDRHTSRRIESEIWFMDKNASAPPVPLGRRIYEGVAVSRIANRISYSISGIQDPAIGRPDEFKVYVAEIEIDGATARIAGERIVYRADNGFEPEPQDFRSGDGELLFAEYYEPKRPVPRQEGNYCHSKGVDMVSGAVTRYVYEPATHNEFEGIFPGGEYICIESSAHNVINSRTPTDVWKFKLDGSGERVRITRMFERLPWRASNPAVSPDGKWLAYMINLHGSEAGYGMGLGLLDLEEWEKSDYAKQVEVYGNARR
jgi:hypothetical protein